MRRRRRDRSGDGSLVYGLKFDMPMTTEHLQAPTTLIDLVSGNNGTAVGDPVINATYTAFDGNDEYNFNGLATDIQSDTKGTISIWLNLSAYNTSPSPISFNDGSANNYVMLDIDSAGKFRAASKVGGVQQWDVRGGAGGYVVNNWCHFAVVQDGTSPILYANGKPISISFDTDTDKTVWFNDITISVCENANLAGLIFLTGFLAHQRYWNRDLSAIEMLAEYNRLKPTYQP